LRRRDTGWIRQRVLDSASVFIRSWRTQNLVIEIAESEPRAASITVEGLLAVFGGLDDVDERLGRGEFVFLGVIYERAHFALDRLGGSRRPSTCCARRRFAAAGIAEAGCGSPICANWPAGSNGRKARCWRSPAPCCSGIRGHRFCGLCGNPTPPAAKRPAICVAAAIPACHTMHFPRTDPAVIMLVTHGEPRAAGPQQRTSRAGMYSTLAGFVERARASKMRSRASVREETAIEVAASTTTRRSPGRFRPTSCSASTPRRRRPRSRSITANWRMLAGSSAAGSPAMPMTKHSACRGSIRSARRMIEDWLGGP